MYYFFQLEFDIDFGKKKEHLTNSILNLFGHKVGHAGHTVSHLSNGAAEVADDMEKLVELLGSHSTNNSKLNRISSSQKYLFFISFSQILP